jgi:hypothetical protein
MLEQTSRRMHRRGTLGSYKIFGQSNLSWLTSIMFPLHGPRKDLAAGAVSRPTTRAHLSKGRKINSLPIAYFMANFAGAFCLSYEA